MYRKPMECLRMRKACRMPGEELVREGGTGPGGRKGLIFPQGAWMFAHREQKAT